MSKPAIFSRKFKRKNDLLAGHHACLAKFSKNSNIKSALLCNKHII